jgi:hypothetical protein
VEAIYYEDDVPENFKDYSASNAAFFAEIGSPGGAAKLGMTANDPAVIKSIPPKSK